MRNKKRIGTVPLRYLIIVIVLYQVFYSAYSQTTIYNQFNDEFQFNRAVSDKWALELDLGQVFSNTPSEDQIFKTLIQGYALFWGHYFISPRWKLSTSLFYYYNHDVPEIGQYDNDEWRLGLQGIYYFNKIRYTLSARMRGELRFVSNEDGIFEDTYRYRQMLKYMKPLNSHVLRQGVFYAVAWDELFFRSNGKNTGFTHFDRNMFTFGGGYMVTDDLQLELTYTNEFLPRDNGNTLNNLFTFTLTTNNLAKRIREKVFGLFIQADEEE
jgi:hypothetical protein